MSNHKQAKQELNQLIETLKDAMREQNLNLQDLENERMTELQALSNGQLALRILKNCLPRDLWGSVVGILSAGAGLGTALLLGASLPVSAIIGTGTAVVGLQVYNSNKEWHETERRMWARIQLMKQGEKVTDEKVEAIVAAQ